MELHPVPPSPLIAVIHLILRERERDEVRRRGRERWRGIKESRMEGGGVTD